jgi:hypothetical protein
MSRTVLIWVKNRLFFQRGRNAGFRFLPRRLRDDRYRFCRAGGQRTGRGILRICGTLAGCILGYELAVLLLGRPVLQAGCFFLLGFWVSYMRFRSRFGYAWLIGGVAALLLMATSLTAPETLYTFAHYRAYEIACGVGSAWLCDAILRLLLGTKGSSATGTASSKGQSTQKTSSELVAVAFVGGLTTLVIPILWLLFNLPSLPQSLVTVLVLLDPNLETIQFKGVQRFLGWSGGPSRLFADH